MRKAMLVLAACGLMATAGLTACTGGRDEPAVSRPNPVRARIGVILPDTVSSQRWRTDDPKFLREAFDEAGVPVEIQNATGDKEKFRQIAEQMIATGVKVLIVVNLDSPSARTVLAQAKAAGVRTIDYDRLTLNGYADYYVSFDNERVGEMQGQGLKRCLAAKGYDNPVVAELNGSPTDNSATEFKTGYDSVLQPMYDAARWTKGPDQSVPDWSNAKATEIFAQMLQQQPRIKGVLAANDGLGNSVIDVLKKNGLNGRIPVTGQDATVQGLQNILAGDQCMTVYKPIRAEAEAAARVAIALFKDQPVKEKVEPVKDPESGAYVQSVRLEPKAIDRSNIDTVIADKFVRRDAICTKAFVAYCEEAGLTAG